MFSLPAFRLAGWDRRTILRRRRHRRDASGAQPPPPSPRPVEPLEPRTLFATNPVPVLNPSFESAAGTDGGTIGVGVWKISGQIGNAFNPSAASYTDADDAASTLGNLPSPADGKQVLFINSAATAAQQLDAALAADTTYTLSVAVGNRTDLTMQNYQVRLLAGQTLLAATTGDGESAPAGSFQDITLTAPALDASNPAIGQLLTIELTNLGNKPAGTQVNFDNVRLTATGVGDPEFDTVAPTATLLQAPNPTAGTTFEPFQVLYQDDRVLEAASIDAQDVTVTNASGVPLAVSLVDVNPPVSTLGGPSAVATFSIAAPGGTWDPADNGPYTITLNAGVFDAVENVNAASTVPFVVDVVPPDTTPPSVDITPPDIQSGTASTVFSVLFADSSSVDSTTVDGKDVSVAGPQGPLAVTLDNVISGGPGGAAIGEYRVAAPGGAWDAADAGQYTITVRPAAVLDTAGNRSLAATSDFAFVAAPPDTEAPDATLVASNPPLTGFQSYDFNVTYTDNQSLVAPGGNSDILVTGPNGFSQAATFIALVSGGNATSKTLTYRIAAPGGAFDTADNGTYTVSTTANATVADTTGNKVRVKTVGTFNFASAGNVGPTASFPANQTLPVAGAATFDFKVTYSDGSVVNAGTIDGGDIVVTGPNNFSGPASLVSGGLGNGSIVTATYRITAPGGSWDEADNGAYAIVLQSGAVADISGTTAPPGSVGTFTVALGADAVGGLDPSFGNGTGVSSFDPPGPGLKAVDTISLPDGSAVSAAFTNVGLGSADVTLFKTTPQGTLDPAFGGSNNGLVSLNLGAGRDDRTTSIVRTADGKFLVSGTTSTYDTGGVELDADFFVARFNANGTVDTTFGTGGFAIATFAGPAAFDRANDLVVLSDSRILVFGQSTASDANGDFALARFSAGGTLDTSFGTGGRVTTNLGGADVVNAVVQDASGKLIAAGSTGAADGNSGSFAIVRYNADGTLDASFGTAGSTLIDFRPGLDEARSVALQDDGKVVVGGLATTGDPDDAAFDSDFALARLTTAGALDATFGSAGKVVTDFGQIVGVNQLVVLPGGKILASGQALSSLSVIGAADVQVALARYNADGTLDATFSDDGKLVVNFEAIEAGVGGAGTTPAATPTASAVQALAISPLADAAALTDLEQKFAQFRQESQGLISITQGGAIFLFATQGSDVEVARIIGDAGAPSLFVAVIANISEIDVDAATFVVRYLDDQAVDASRLGTGDIRVTGPNGFNQLAEFIDFTDGVTGNAAERTARYRIKPASGGVFTNADEGSYALAVEANRIADVNGNALPAQAIPNGTFTVTVPENVANLRVDGPLTGKFATSVVGGAKASGATLKVTNDGTVDAKATVTVTVFASADQSLDETEDTSVLVINGVKLSLKPGKGKTLKLKFTQYPATLPDGPYYLIARLDSGEAIPELKESDNNAATATPITIAAPFVDLSGTPGPIKGTLAPGAKVTASVTVSNAGNIAVKQSVPVSIVASPGDQSIGNNDTPVATPNAKLAVNPSSSKAVKLTFTIPATLAPGTYFLLATLDATHTLTTETKVDNNLVVLGSFVVAG